MSFLLSFDLIVLEEEELASYRCPLPSFAFLCAFAREKGSYALVRELGVNALELCLALRAGKRLGFVDLWGVGKEC